MSGVMCSWCQTDDGPPGPYVVLFGCVREHMHARPLCEEHAIVALRDKAVSQRFTCRECREAGHADGPSYVDLVVTRPDWMRLVESGQIRLARQ